jgi:CBS domain-containing protein
MRMHHLAARLVDVFPDIFTKPVITTDPKSPLIYSGSLLHISDVSMLPVEKKEVLKTTKTGKLYGAFGSYAVMSGLVVLPPENSYKFLWSATENILIWIGSVSFEDDLDHVLSVFEDTGFGAARLTGRQGRTLITLENFVDKLRSRELASGLDLEQISSEPISVSKDVMLGDAIHLMFKARVRRLFVDDEPTRFVSDRTILALLFSPYMLKIARDTPSKWLDLRVDQLPKGEAAPVQPEASLAEGATLLGRQPDDCLITNKNRVVTRWDLIIKAWKKDLNLVAVQSSRAGARANHPARRKSH